MKNKKHVDFTQAQARREQILTAAADCFRRKGYHGAGMAEIAKIAGMSAGHMYHYFDNKEAIIESIIQRDMEEMFSIFQEFENMPGERVSVLLDGLGNAVERHTNIDQGALNLEMLAEAARNKKVANLLQATDAHARNRMRQLLMGERGPLNTMPKDELDGRIDVIFAMISGLLLRKMLNPGLNPDMLLKSLRPAMKTLLTMPV